MTTKIDYLKNYEYVFNNNPDYDMGGKNKNDPVYKAPADFLKKNKGKFKSHIDVSSGKGFFFDFIADLGLCSISTDLKKFHSLNIPFIEIDLTNKEDLNKLKENHYDVLTCTGVLEHIEEEYVDDVLKTFSEISDVCLLTIAKHSDVQFGIVLHVIIEDENWWRQRLLKYFELKNLEMFYDDGRLFYFELESKTI